MFGCTNQHIGRVKSSKLQRKVSRTKVEIIDNSNYTQSIYDESEMIDVKYYIMSTYVSNENTNKFLVEWFHKLTAIKMK